MPKTIAYRPILADELVSKTRLDSYVNVFSPSNDIELFGAYLWNSHVCSTFHPLIGAVEVALRNAIDTALTASVAPTWWNGVHLLYASYTTHPGATLPHAVKCVRDNFVKAHNSARSDKRERYGIPHPVPTRHEILAKTEFSTWEFLLDSEFNGPSLYWPANLGQVFRGDWKGRTPGQLLVRLRVLIKIIRQFRNRVSHHEPVWKKFGVLNERDAVLHLLEKLDDIKEMIEFIHPEKLKLLRVSGLLSAVERACTVDELRHFQNMTRSYKIKSAARLHDVAKVCSSSNSRVKISVYVHGRLRQFQVAPI